MPEGKFDESPESARGSQNEIRFAPGWGRRLGVVLISLGICLLLFPVVTFIQGVYSQHVLERQFDDLELTQLEPMPAVKHSRMERPPDTMSSEDDFPATRIQIPRIGLRAVVVEGDDPASLRKGPAHMPGTAGPGEYGNCCIAGHRNTYGAWFRKLDRLDKGDKIILHAAGTEYIYRVVDAFNVDPTDVYVLEQTIAPTLTLITCVPGSRPAMRLIVVADLDIRRRSEGR